MWVHLPPLHKTQLTGISAVADEMTIVKHLGHTRLLLKGLESIPNFFTFQENPRGRVSVLLAQCLGAGSVVWILSVVSREIQSAFTQSARGCSIKYVRHIYC